jgi:serine/threonine protein kinase
MGEVWRANDTRLGRAVAVKILPHELAHNAQLKVRFEREARAISQLSHPNICTLHDVGEENGTSFLVMELLEGETLAQRLERGALPLQEVLRFGVQIAVALDRAHRQHVVHRDLKPANVMLTRSGAKLLDFGLAKTIAAEPISASVMTQKLDDRQPLTAEGTIVGTFQYMAPEQLEGADADARTDIFALGAVLYEMTTGRRAFQGKTRTSLIAAIIRGEPQPIAELQPLTPPALEHVIARCLAKDPEDRWQSAADVAAELEWISRSGSQASVAAPVIERRKRRERTWMAIAGVLALASIALAVLLARRTTPAFPSVRANVVSPSGTTFILSQGQGGSITVSPDGKWLTFAAVGPQDQDPTLWIRSIDSLEARKLITEPFDFPFWSPDSRSIAYFSRGDLKRIEIGGGPPSIICDTQEGRGGTWRADGTIVFAPHWRGGLHRVSASGGKSQPLTQLDEKAGETTHRFPSFLPDGKHFVYLSGTHLAAPSSERNAIYLASLDSKERKLLLRARSNAIYSNGHLLFVRENYLLAQPFDADALELRGEPKRIADGVDYESGFFCAAFAAGGDGTLLIGSKAAPIEEPIVWRDRSGKQLGIAATAPGPWHHRLSRDGRYLVMVYGDPGDVWLQDLVRGGRRRLTHDPLNDFLPVWSPDGTRVVYGSDRSLFTHLFMSRTDGAGKEEALLQTPQMKSPTDWSPDGRHLFFDAASDANTSKNDLWVLDMTDRKPRRLTTTDFDEWGSRMSPDGRWITYLSDESGRREIYVTSFPTLGERQQVSTNGSAAEGIWTSGGREIVYMSTDQKLMSVRVTRSGNALQVDAPQELFKLPLRAFVDVTADGQKFLVYEPAPGANTPLTLVTRW